MIIGDIEDGLYPRILLEIAGSNASETVFCRFIVIFGSSNLATPSCLAKTGK